MKKNKAKGILKILGVTPEKLYQGLTLYFLKRAVAQQKLGNMIKELRKIVPDISDQEASSKEAFNNYWEFKRRALQSFQCTLMLEALKRYSKRDLTVADIGDSAGTHMLYLKKLTDGLFNIDTISINLDPRAIKKIEGRGLKAVLCRAESLDLPQKADLVTTFQMVEHLHNPSIFFRRLAKGSAGDRIVLTVPYLKKSRVGLYHARKFTGKNIYAEDEHIFELSPEDWTLLALHSGWRVSYSKIYYQYPRKWPVISSLCALIFKKGDFEGFWGAILEKDTLVSDLYQDWEE